MLYRERLTVHRTERETNSALYRERLAWCSTETLIMQYRERETSIEQREASMVQYRDFHYAVQRERD